jgi:hypothetical protein
MLARFNKAHGRPELIVDQFRAGRLIPRPTAIMRRGIINIDIHDVCSVTALQRSADRTFMHSVHKQQHGHVLADSIRCRDRFHHFLITAT